MAVLAAPPYLQFFDENGDPLSNGFVYTYAAGTLNPKATYTDQGAGTENSNPVELDAAGIPEPGGSIWINGSYKFVVKDSLGNTISTTDNVTAFTATADSATAYFQAFSGDGATTVFTLSQNFGTDEKTLMVFVDPGSGDEIGFDIQPPSAYTVNGTSLTFAVAPAVGTSNIQVWAPSTQVGAAAASAEAADASADAAAVSAAAADVARIAAQLAETNAETAETNAETAETNAETALAAAIVARDAAIAAKVAAELAETNAETAETNAETAETNAETAETNAEAAQAAAEAARDAALAAQTAAETAETNAETAETNAETAETNAEAAAALAATYLATVTSTTSLLIAVASKTFVTTAVREFIIGQFVIAASNADPANFMFGQVTSWNSGTRNLIVDVQVVGGAGTFADWNISISGVRGAIGATGSPSNALQSPDLDTEIILDNNVAIEVVAPDGINITGDLNTSGGDVQFVGDFDVNGNANISGTLTADLITEWIKIGTVATVADGDYNFIPNVPHAGAITAIRTIADSGTCTLTMKVGSTALGGTANSVSSSNQEQAHTTSNTFSIGNLIKGTVSSNSACTNMTVWGKITRAM
jgi:hypothetical protein